jgi:hypothetical protein
LTSSFQFFKGDGGYIEGVHYEILYPNSPYPSILYYDLPQSEASTPTRVRVDCQVSPPATIEEIPNLPAPSIKAEKYELFMKWLESQEAAPPVEQKLVEEDEVKEDFVDAGGSSEEEFMETENFVEESKPTEVEPEKVVEAKVEEAVKPQIIQANFTLTNVALEINTSMTNLSVSTPTVSEKGSTGDLSAKKPVSHNKGKAPPVPVTPVPHLARSSPPRSTPSPVAGKSGNASTKKPKSLFGSITSIFKHDTDAATKEKQEAKLKETEI